MSSHGTELTHWMRYASDMMSVLRLSGQLAGGIHRLEQLLSDIVDAAKTLSDADRCSLFLVNHEQGFLWSTIAHGSGTITVPLGVGIVGSVAEHGEAINIPDAYQDDRFDRTSDSRSGYRTRAILSVPLTKHSGEVIGVIQALNKVDGAAFTSYDQALLTSLCGQAAVALDNAQLIERDREYQQMLRDLELARQIQEAMHPQTLPDSDHWHFVAWQQSCDQVGGDFYDFMTRENNIDAVIADVSGHGVGAALVVNTARSAIRVLYDALPNHELLTRVNRHLEQDLSSDSFLTLAMSTFCPDGSLELVACGHEPPLVYRRQSDSFDDIDPGNLVLGIMPDVTYDLQRIAPLQRGDRVVMTTDGFLEAERLGQSTDGDHQQWGMDGLQNAVRSHHELPLTDMIGAMVKEVVNWRGSSSFEDDVTVIAAEYLGP